MSRTIYSALVHKIYVHDNKYWTERNPGHKNKENSNFQVIILLDFLYNAVYLFEYFHYHLLLVHFNLTHP